MSIPVHPRTLAGVPLLIAEPAPSDALLPVVLWHHGYTADALAHAGELERCAAAGFLAVGVDAPLHGARREDATLAARVAAAPGGSYEVVLDIVEQGALELPALLAALAAEYPVDRARLSLVGISMGAFLAYRAVAGGVSLRAAVALLGTPEWPRDSSPHRTPAAFRDTALLSITAERDGHVDPSGAQRLHAALGLPAAASATHRHHVLAGAGHLTSAEEWSEAMEEVMQWLRGWG
jgi:dienelactone hydrolase